MLKHWKNLKYIVRHKIAVFRMGLKYRVWWHQLLLHDWSKFTPLEWFGYTNYFYGVPYSKEVLTEMRRASVWEIRERGWKWWELREAYKKRFLEAWNAHQKRNKHHWQYWVLRNDDGDVVALKMPERFVREMVADWAGASIAIRGYDDTINWYRNNQALMLLHPETRELVESLIGYYRPEDGVLPAAA